MNDRFKFRIWWKKENRYRVDTHIIPIGHLTDFANSDQYVVEQCTGLKDKNGNLIYENDRVGFYVYGQDEEWHAQQGTVIWYNSCWGIETSSRFIQFENELTMKNPKDIEIIGNIHEQKEH